MTAARPEVPLQVITPDDTRASIRRAQRSLERAASEIVWQIEMEGWRTLGYPSWSAMREAEYGDVAFMVPSKGHRGWQEVSSTPEPAAYEAEVTAVTGTCNGCGSPMTGRPNRRYCSNACRQRAYRNSQRVNYS